MLFKKEINSDRKRSDSVVRMDSSRYLFVKVRCHFSLVFFSLTTFPCVVGSCLAFALPGDAPCLAKNEIMRLMVSRLTG